LVHPTAVQTATLMERAGGAFYGWGASQPVLEKLNCPFPIVLAQPKPAAKWKPSWQKTRREAVKREVETFLKAEDRRQAGIKKLLDTIHIIDKLDTDFGNYSQFGRTLRSELGELKRKLRGTQKSFQAADGGFLQTYALGRHRRIKEAERYEGKDGEVDYDENVRDITADGELGNDDDAAVQSRIALEQDMRDVDLRLDQIFKSDVMLETNIEEMLQEAKDIKASCTNTFLNLTFRSNDLHVRLDSWQSNITKIVGLLTEDPETTYDLVETPLGAQTRAVSAEGVPQCSVEEYLTESKTAVDEIFASIAQRRAIALEFTEQFSDKSAQITADIRAENERLQAELLQRQDEYAEELRAKEAEITAAQAEIARQRKISTDDYARLTLQNHKELEALSSGYRAQLDAANQALEEESNKAKDFADKLERESECHKKANSDLQQVFAGRAALMESIKYGQNQVRALQSLMGDLQAQLDAAAPGDGAELDRLRVLEEQLRTGIFFSNFLESQSRQPTQILIHAYMYIYICLCIYIYICVHKSGHKTPHIKPQTP